MRGEVFSEEEVELSFKINKIKSEVELDDFDKKLNTLGLSNEVLHNLHKKIEQRRLFLFIDSCLNKRKE